MADTDSPAQDAYQSLYRRFRPQRFDEVLGQDHVELALRNAVRQGKVGHAYLFSGPRGTGKTSTARILAKALNCAAPTDGEPCGTCDSCVEIARGTSLDVHELDAASNNGVDAMRDLVARAALGTPGRWKVYIVDEVHMLTAAASNALLKTLEEPPGHVVFVLATTDAQKVLPTIRSRTQHFEFRLLGPDTLAQLVSGVRDAAGLALGDDAVAAAVRKGRGSARDALSALDQVAAAGMVEDEVAVLADLGAALAERDSGRALVAVAHAAAAGRDMHNLTGALVEHLRQGFLATVAPDLVTVAGDDRAQVEDMARRMGLPAVVRAMETLGRSQVDMRDAPDPRVNLETALIRLAHPEADDTPAALLERLDRLERGIAAGGAVAGVGGAGPAGAGAGPGQSPPVAPPPVAPVADEPSSSRRRPTSRDDGGTAASPRGQSARARSTGSPAGPDPDDEPSPPGSAVSGPGLARQSLGALRRQSRQGAGREAPPGAAPGGPAISTAPPAPTAQAPAGTTPTRDELVQAWGDVLLAQLPSRARARFRVGRFLAVDGPTAVFALPNETHRVYCEEVRTEVERVLAGHFGTAVPMRLVVDAESDAGAGPVAARGTAPTGAARQGEDPGAAGEDAPEDESALLDPEVLAAETEPAVAGPSPEQRLKEMFPGAQEL